MYLKPLYIGGLTLENNILLAPMAGVTDLPFRLLCKYQGCGLVFTEMVSAKGLMYGNENTGALLASHRDEKPVSVQIFGSSPEIIADAIARLDAGGGIDAFDINMGCPVPKIIKNGEGSALMKDPGLVAEIVARASAATDKPVTVKIRKGFDSDNINAVEISVAAWRAGAKAITVHGRTRAQFYGGKADWDIIRRVKESVGIPVIGNGDIVSAQSAEKMFLETGCDGIMIGRAAQGNPWIFNEIIRYLTDGVIPPPPTSAEKAETALWHAGSLINYKGERTGVNEMRKHLSWYTRGIPGASKFRAEMNTIKSLSEIERLIEKIFNKTD